MSAAESLLEQQPQVLQPCVPSSHACAVSNAMQWVSLWAHPRVLHLLQRWYQQWVQP